MTVFLAKVSNKTEKPIKWDPSKAILMTEKENLSVLNLEQFHKLFPQTEERSCAYEFLFKDSVILEKKPKKKNSPEILFQGKEISAKTTVKKLLVFERTSIYNKRLSLIIPFSNEGREFNTELKFISRLKRRTE